MTATGTEQQPPRAQHSDSQQQAAAAAGGRPPRPSFSPRRFQSSWDAKEAGGGRSADSDYLSELGAAQQYNINVDHGQTAGMIDSIFTGNVLGHKSDIAGVWQAPWVQRTLQRPAGARLAASALAFGAVGSTRGRPRQPPTSLLTACADVSPSLSAQCPPSSHPSSSWTPCRRRLPAHI